jgi:glycosyltransferase involved in cell wall biosynthesis
MDESARHSPRGAANVKTPARATVVIPCFNCEHSLAETLAALDADPDRDSLTVIVVDNGSTDGSLRVARKAADVVLVEHRQRGPGPTRNRGFVAASTETVLSIDADCLPQSGWAGALIRALEREERDVISVAGVTKPQPSDDRWSQRSDLTPHPAHVGGNLLYSVAGNAAYRRSLVLQLGGFPSVGADDAAFGVRAREAGYRFAAATSAVVYHRNPQGIRGYWIQMRKVGRYTAELTPPPRRKALWYALVMLRAAAGLRPLLRGNMHEGLATAVRALAQALGAWPVWSGRDAR